MEEHQITPEQREFDAQVVECLIDRLQRVPSVITYGALADEMASRFGLEDARAWHYFDASLGRVQDVCESLGLPSLPVMVVRKEGMRPGTGYASYYRTKHRECEAMSDEEIAKQQWANVRKCADWQELLNHYGIEMTFEGPKDALAELRAREGYEESRRVTMALRSEMERNPEARKRCLELKGDTCEVCKFNSREMLGVPGIIHVHHIKPLYELAVGESANTDAIEDLVPVCPNCHALIHSKGPRECYTIEEAKAIVGRKPIELG